ANVGRVDGHPAEAGEVDLGAAVLGASDVRGTSAEAAIAELALRHSQAVDIARGKSGCARQADVQRIEVGAFALQVAGLQHALDVADAAAAHFRVAGRVIDDPLVDRARLLQLAELALGDVARRVPHDSIRGNQVGRREIERRGGGVERLDGRVGLAQVDGAIDGRKAAHYLDHRV